MSRHLSLITIGLLLLSISLSGMAQELKSAAGVRMTVDSPLTTLHGNKLIAPAEWLVTVRGPATILEAPEGDSWIVVVDVQAKDGAEALTKGLAAYKEVNLPLFVENDLPDEAGWTKQRQFVYETAPNEQREFSAGVMFGGDEWSLWIYDMAYAVAEKRGAQVGLIFDSMEPKGYTRESFAGRKANKIGSAEIKVLSQFIKDSQAGTVPGVAMGIIQDGEVVFAGGFGVREYGGDIKVDADTLFMIGSNTKALTTLLLGKLVDEGQLKWDTQVQQVFPRFKLGDADTASRVRIEHLVCACTGLPRQDMEWIFQYDGVTPAASLDMLGTMQPTSDFGEMFQYSNLLAGAAGFVGAYVLFPELELGLAYDKAMQSKIFDPLGMHSTTFDYALALSGNHASAHATTIDGETAPAAFELNYAIVPTRPAGAAWSSVNDMLKYVAMELANGQLPDGKKYISEQVLLERRAAKVPTNKEESYGMGLAVSEKHGVQLVHHGGATFGYHSDMMWLPEHNVGAVVLTNGNPGWSIHSNFRRKLLEVLFDGEAEADANMASDTRRFFEYLAGARKLLVIPADTTLSSKLAMRYSNDALGDIAVSHHDNKTQFDFGEWQSEVASRNNTDGTVSFVTTAPGAFGFEFVVGSDTKRTLTLRDAQHEYVFVEQ